MNAQVANSPTLAPGAESASPHIGDWRLLRLLSQTRYSRVFRARPWDCPLDWPADYVVKMAVDDDPADAPAANALLQREARVARRVCDPHVAAVLEYNVESAPHFLVMPYLEGGTVASRIRRNGPLPLAIALWIARQTVEGLKSLHQCGFLHGDVKPDNVMMSSAGHVTLTDLAFARPLDVTRGEQGCLMTTLRYAAPELFRTGERITAASDVYSLGVMFFEMLSGNPPFRQTDADALITAHLEQTPDEPDLAGIPLPPRVARLLRSLLAKQPLRRPSLVELKRTLVELEIEWLAERSA